MMVAIATGIGLQETIREKVAAFNGHLQISNFDTNESKESVNPISRDQDFYPTFNNVDGIQYVQTVATKAGIIRTENTFELILAKGADSDYHWKYFNEFLVEGRVPDFTQERENREVLISRYLANRLDLNLNDTFKTNFLKKDSKIPNERTFKIVGIYSSGFQEFDANVILIDIRHIQRMNKWKPDQVGNFEIYLDDFDLIDAKEEEVYANISPLLDTSSIKQKYSYIFEWIALFDNNIYLIIGIIIIVAGMNMITALLVLILDRTQMIGILKSLGSSNWEIRKIFLYNASYLIGIGLFWGNLIGITALLLQKNYGILKFPNPEQYHTTIIPIHFDIGFILLLNIGTLLLCLLMLLLPSYIITKISPVKAIKFE